MTPSFALAIPHTTWVPDRVESMQRMLAALLPLGAAPIDDYRQFTDREPNRVWAQKLWRWGASTKATHLVQLQDDVIPAPNFWAVLRAMVEANPDRFIGLEANHPLCRELARQGKRWVRTRAWVVGVGYEFPLAGPDSIHEFLAWCDKHPAFVDSMNEDQLISVWLASTSRDAWHPIPTIIDHDLTVPSTYENAHDDHRRPVVTWHGYGAQIEDPAWWTVPADVPLLPGAGWPKCYFCLEHPGRWTSHATGATLCPACYARIVQMELAASLERAKEPVAFGPVLQR